MRDYVAGRNNQPLPLGTRFITAKGAEASHAAAVADTYYKFDYTFTQCDAEFPGCRGWNITLETVGVYDGTHVYQWYVFCTPAGSYFHNACTWRGSAYNGGTYLSWCGCGLAMQFGENSEAYGNYSGTDWFWEAGQRVWVDSWGAWFDLTSWY